MRLDSPRTVLGAGLLVCLQGAAGVVFAVLLVISGLSGSSAQGANIYGEAAYFVVLAGGVLACGVGLVLGKHWARGPSIVLQLLLLGVSWYVIGPSGQPLYGIPIAALCAAVLVLLFLPPSVEWAQGTTASSED